MARKTKAAASGRPKAPLSALRPLLPFALRYRGRIAAGILALICASGSTLVVPIAMRRVIDHGFTADGSGVIYGRPADRVLGRAASAGILTVAGERKPLGIDADRVLAVVP